MRRFKLTYYLLIALMSVVNLSGCSQDEFTENQDKEQSQVKAQLILSLSIPVIGTRAEGITLSGTAGENKCRKLTLFVMSTDGTNIQDYTVTGENLENKNLLFNVTNSQGAKKILVAANMSDTQIAAIKNTKNCNPEQIIQNISDITTEGNFLMTGQAVDRNNSQIITIEANQTIEIKASLTRVMSKVLLTCSTKDDNALYVKLAQDNGYIRLEDIHYILETTNKKFFPFEKNKNEDPNFLMSNTLADSYGNNFFRATIDETEGAIAIKYDASRLTEGDYQYTEGIYCLENTIKIDDVPSDSDDPKKVATYFKIAAKFTPKNIDGSENLSEERAKRMLNAGTFYTCKKAPANVKNMCYSSIAEGIAYLSNKNTTVTNEDFTIHEGGWQRYETFINSPTNFSEAAGLIRNNYYIINVTSFTAPLVDKTIEVNTIVAPWTTKGKTTIEVETGNNK